jgi:rifampin ADP-ribosylating transferase
VSPRRGSRRKTVEPRCSSAPLRVVGEITEWKRLTPEQLQEWRERLSALLSNEHAEIIN